MINFEYSEDSSNSSIDNFFFFFDFISMNNLFETENHQDECDEKFQEKIDFEIHNLPCAEKFDKKDKSYSREFSKEKEKKIDYDLSKEASNFYINVEECEWDDDDYNRNRRNKSIERFSRLKKLTKLSKKKLCFMNLGKERKLNRESHQEAFGEILKENKYGLAYLEERDNEIEKREVVENPEKMKRRKKDKFCKNFDLKVNNKKKICFLEYNLIKHKKNAEENNFKLLLKKKYRDESSQEDFHHNDYLKKPIPHKIKEKENSTASFKNQSSKGFFKQKWSDEEHREFIDAMLNQGKDWKNIKKQLNTKSYFQIFLYTTRFFKRIKKALNIDFLISFNSMTLFKRYFLNKNLKNNQQIEQPIKINEKKISLQARNLNSNSTNNSDNFNDCCFSNHEEIIYDFISEANDFNLKNFYKKYKSAFAPEIKDFFINNLLMFKKKQAVQNSVIDSKKDLKYFGLSIQDISLNFNLNDKVENHFSNNINCFKNKITEKFTKNQISNFPKKESFFDKKGKMIKFSNHYEDDEKLINELKSNNSDLDKYKKFEKANLFYNVKNQPFSNKISFNHIFKVKKNNINNTKINLQKIKTKNIFIINKERKSEVGPLKKKNFNEYLDKSKPQKINISSKNERGQFHNDIQKTHHNNNNSNVLNLTENNISMASQFSKNSCSTKFSENINNLQNANFNQKENDTLDCNFFNFEKNFGFNSLPWKKLNFKSEENEKAKPKEKSDFNFKAFELLSEMKNSFPPDAEALFNERNQYSCRFKNIKNTEIEIREEKKNIPRMTSLFDDLKLFLNKQQDFKKSNFLMKDCKNINEPDCLYFNSNNINVNISNKDNLKNISNNGFENTISPNQISFLGKNSNIEVLYNINEESITNNNNIQNNHQNLKEKSNLINNENVSNILNMTSEELRNINDIFSNMRFNHHANFNKNMMIGYINPMVYNKKVDNRPFYDNFINNMHLLKKRSSDLNSESREIVFTKKTISENTFSNPFALDFNYGYSINRDLEILGKEINNYKEIELSDDFEFNSNSYSGDFYN